MKGGQALVLAAKLPLTVEPKGPLEANELVLNLLPKTCLEDEARSRPGEPGEQRRPKMTLLLIVVVEKLRKLLKFEANPLALLSLAKLSLVFHNP